MKRALKFIRILFAEFQQAVFLYFCSPLVVVVWAGMGQHFPGRASERPGSRQGRAVALRSEPLTARAVLEKGVWGKGQGEGAFRLIVRWNRASRSGSSCVGQFWPERGRSDLVNTQVDLFAGVRNSTYRCQSTRGDEFGLTFECVPGANMG
jgi:hypothetical protein